jgi:hypothetical protein
MLEFEALNIGLGDVVTQGKGFDSRQFVFLLHLPLIISVLSAYPDMLGCGISKHITKQ